MRIARALVCLTLCACRNEPSTASLPPAAPSPSWSPVRAPAAAAPRVDVHALPAWTTPAETLFTRAGPVWTLAETRTHIAWAEPQEARSGQLEASLHGFVKGATARDTVLATAPVNSTYTSSSAVLGGGSELVLITPGPGEVSYGTAVVVGPGVRTVPLPAHVSVYDGLPLAAATLGTLVVATDAVVGSSSLVLVGPSGTRTVHVEGAVTAIAAHDGDVSVVYMDATSANVVARLDVAAGTLQPLLTRPKAVESVALRGGALVWTELEQELGFRINSVFTAGASGTARVVGKLERPRNVRIAGDRACWATFEPRGGPTAYDAVRHDPTGPIDTFVLCASLTTGTLERAVGPLPQSAIGFAVDEHHVYWAEVEGQSTTFKRRAVR